MRESAIASALFASLLVPLVSALKLTDKLEACAAREPDDTRL